MQNNQENKLVLIEDLGMKYPKENSKKKIRYGLYQCECGNITETRTQDVNRNKIISCGCVRNKYKMSNHKLYGTWRQMIQRCTNKNHKSYKEYGEKGIAVCLEWLDINNFINDMYSTFQDGLTLDRKNNNLGYSPTNCRWATRNIQARNTRILMCTNKSGYRGVSWKKSTSKWITQIQVNSNVIHIGCYDDKIEAAMAYDNYIINNNLEHTKNF